MTPDVGEGLMFALAACWKRERVGPVRGGDLVLELVEKYRRHGDLAAGSGDLLSYLRGRDFDQYLPAGEEMPSDPRISRRVTSALNEAAWMAQGRNDRSGRSPEPWALDVRTLLILAFLNASVVDDTVVSWHHCMNIAFAFEMLEPRAQPTEGDPASGIAVLAHPRPWTPFADMAALLGVTTSKTPGAVTGTVSGMARMARREVRRYGPVAFLLQRESLRAAVREGDGVVMPVHVLMAVASAAQQVRTLGSAVSGRFASEFWAGFSLLDNGIDAASLHGTALVVAETPLYEGPHWQRGPKDPAVGSAAFALFEDASARGGGRIGDGDLVRSIAASDDPAILSILETVDLDF